MHTHRYLMQRAAALGVLALLVPLGACEGTRHQLLDAATPDIINPSAVTSPEAADALRVGALARIRQTTAGGEGAWLLGTLLTDEWRSSDTFSQRNETDQRTVQESNANVQTMYTNLQRVRNSAREAINALVKYKPTPAWGVGQMWWAMGYTEMQLAQVFCNGIPLGDASSGVPVYTTPLTNAAVYAVALAHIDSALSFLGATDATTAALKTTAQITRARIMVDLGQFAAAAALVNSIPTSFANPVVTFSMSSGDNQIWSLNNSAKRWTVGDSLDFLGRINNAIPFASANDPRVPVRGSTLGTSAAGRGFDGSTNLVVQLLWGRDDPVNIVSGIDARLIEAEAALQTQDIAGMMTILNALRSSSQTLGSQTGVPVTSGVMPPLATPASQSDAVDLFFREKAFWQFGRGFRLDDSRRLIRQYGRTQDTVFPTGNAMKSGPYGTDVNFPVTTNEYQNPNFKGCLDRKA
ncbi:MAG TPA: hypothetical protein VHE78_10735 [Gemmatimonadaceae bacterium]|nr:hypothetical protein [Gemmatimonadaceae bacterium]